jgi:hypothetical protein
VRESDVKITLYADDPRVGERAVDHDLGPSGANAIRIVPGKREGTIVVHWYTGQQRLNGGYRADLVMDRADVARLFIEAFAGASVESMLKLLGEASERCNKREW